MPKPPVVRNPAEQECALEHLLYEMLILESALMFRDIRYLFSFFPKIDWGVPQIAQDVIRLKIRLLLSFLEPAKSSDPRDVTVRDFPNVLPDSCSTTDTETFERLRSTIDTIHQGTVHLSWNRVRRSPATKADRQQMEKDAVFLIGKAAAFVDRARTSGLNLSTIAKDRLEIVNRLYGLLRTTSRVEEGKANRPPERKRIDIEKLLSGDQQLDVSSKPPATKSGISQR